MKLRKQYHNELVELKGWCREVGTVVAKFVCTEVVKSSLVCVKSVGIHSIVIWHSAGNIRVLCRVRPVIAEDDEHPETVVSCDAEDESLLTVQYKGRTQWFDLDRVLDSHISQQEVCAHFNPLLPVV